MSVTYKLRMFAVAIVLTSIIGGLSFAVVSKIAGSETPQVTISIGMAAAIGAVPTVTILGFLIGMPIAYLLNRASVHGSVAWATVGLLVGGIICAILAIILSGGVHSNADLVGVLSWVAIGAPPGLAAGAFWWRTVAKFEQGRGAAF